MNRQKGFTLIELVVALSLGMLVTLAATQIFMTNQNTFNAQRGTVDMSANGRIALDQLARSVRQAGYGFLNTTRVAIPTSAAQTVQGTLVSGDAASVVGGFGPNSDQLVVQYMAAEGGVDCEGTAVARDGWVTERYFLLQDTDAVPGLACDGNDPQQVGTVLARGVENFQILLGVDSVADTYAAVTQYLTVAAYNALAGTLPPILSIRVGMLVRSEQPVPDMPAVENPIYVLQDVIQVDDLPKDRRLRRVFTSTIGINNADLTGA